MKQLAIFLILIFFGLNTFSLSLNNTKTDGYRAIWFELGQKYPDGDSHNFSKSELYFGDFDGNIWKLPYEIKEDFEKPMKY